MSTGKIAIPTSLRSSSLNNLSKTAMTRSANVAGEVLYVDPEECYVVVNPRKKFNLELVETYTQEFLDPEQGQREPCHVYPKDEQGYRIHHGASRRMAAIKAKETDPTFKLKVIIDKELSKRSDYKNYFEQGSNNILRDNMSVFDQADWIADCIAMAEAEGVKLTLTDMAKNLAMSKTKVSRIYALRNAAPEIREVYETKTQDPETLTNLVKIRDSHPDLFKALLDTTELDRATVREAAKSGKLPAIDQQHQVIVQENDKPENELVPETAPENRNDEGKNLDKHQGFDLENFVAHAQQQPLQDIELGYGSVTIFSQETASGYAVAATTDFPAGNEMKLADNNIKFWADAPTAMNQAYLDLSIWAKKVEKEAALSQDQREDIVLLAGFLRMRLVLETDGSEQGSRKQKSPKARNKSTDIVGEWNGKSCILITDQSILTESEIEALGTSSMVYVEVDGKRCQIKPEEFALKSVKYKD